MKMSSRKLSQTSVGLSRTMSRNVWWWITQNLAITRKLSR